MNEKVIDVRKDWISKLFEGPKNIIAEERRRLLIELTRSPQEWSHARSPLRTNALSWECYFEYDRRKLSLTTITSIQSNLMFTSHLAALRILPSNRVRVNVLDLRMIRLDESNVCLRILWYIH